jgi:hypothetical protein
MDSINSRGLQGFHIMGILAIAGLVLLFFVSQCSLCLLAVRFIRGQRLSIERRKASEVRDRDTSGSSPWLSWVDDAFPRGTVSNTGWSRDDAFEMLDESVTAIQSYQWLQRLAVMAPLVGVLITAIGLASLRVPANQVLTLSTILGAVTPLFSGVIVGASLAIWNQILLQIVQWQIQQLRETAQRWFDREIWSRAIAAPREAVESTIAALRELARSIKDTAKVQRANALRTRRATRAVVRASLASENAFKGFGTGLAEFSSQIRTLQKITESTRILAQSMEPSLRKAHDALMATVNGFQKAVDDQFIPAARNHAEAAKHSAKMAEKTLAILRAIEETTRKLQDQCDQLVSSTQDLGRSGDKLKKSIEETLVPANGSLHDAATTLNRAAGAIPDLFKTSAAAFSSTADYLRMSLEIDLVPAATQLHESIENDLGPAIRQQKLVMEDSSKVSEGLKALFLLIQGSATSLEDRYVHLAAAANNQSLASEEIYQSLKKGLIPNQEKIGKAASDLAGSATALSSFLNEGLNPATARLAELGQIIAPMREAAGAIGALGNLNGELGELASIVRRLRDAVDSAKVLSELESIIGQLSGSFQKADELRQTVSEMPDLFARQINELSNRALRRQADDLKETLSDIAKQFGWFTPSLDGNAESHR